ncbi:hypothetical protein EYF80_063586 [Liparis tanakae]|uniref:Uncharacterized protein n=1 Tax=Liparis tanakae TaxID=230148 RepID=A0A4Z2EBL6_9TELE|nr:hypothetical protein EYF80_063586 [Liparis tanakae]
MNVQRLEREEEAEPLRLREDLTQGEKASDWLPPARPPVPFFLILNENKPLVFTHLKLYGSQQPRRRGEQPKKETTSVLRKGRREGERKRGREEERERGRERSTDSTRVLVL